MTLKGFAAALATAFLLCNLFLVFHEGGHWIVYRLAGVQAHVVGPGVEHQLGRDVYYAAAVQHDPVSPLLAKLGLFGGFLGELVLIAALAWLYLATGWDWALIGVMCISLGLLVSWTPLASAWGGDYSELVGGV